MLDSLPLIATDYQASTNYREVSVLLPRDIELTQIPSVQLLAGQLGTFNQ